MVLLVVTCPSWSPAEKFSAKRKSRSGCTEAQVLLTKLWHCWVAVLHTAGILWASSVIAKDPEVVTELLTLLNHHQRLSCTKHLPGMCDMGKTWLPCDSCSKVVF